MADSKFIFGGDDLEQIDRTLDRIIQASDLADPKALPDVQLLMVAFEEKLLSLKAATVAKDDVGGQEGGTNVFVPLGGDAAVEAGESRPRKRRASLVETTSPEQMQDNINNMPVSAIKHKSWSQATREDIKDLAQSYYAALLNSSADVERDIGLWFDR